MRTGRGVVWAVLAPLGAAAAVLAPSPAAAGEIGREVAVERHLEDGEEHQIGLRQLVRHGQRLFEAAWTVQEGGGRPLTKGNGAPLADPDDPLLFPRNFNRLSAPDANSCAGCHNVPRPGGGGDFVANVFVLGQRFDFATFDHDDRTPTRGAMDERGRETTLQSLANSRNTLGMFGSGFIEMLARQMTERLQHQRDRLAAGSSVALRAKGVSFGTLRRRPDGGWDTSAVEGLPEPSLESAGPDDPPSLVIMPFHQAGAVVSLRQFTNNAFNHHHGIQASERFGDATDPDGDGFADEMTRADVTAATVFQAQLAVPGRVIPRDPEIEAAVLLGETLFAQIGCDHCHVPALPLTRQGWIFTEPNPFNPPGNLRPEDGPVLAVDLTSRLLDRPRLEPDDRGIVWVPAFTDLKLHDVTDGRRDPHREPLDMHSPAGTARFFRGNSRFLTRKLWGIANEPPFFHHGQLTTMREAIEAHHGEAEASRQGWEALSDDGRDAIVEFLKTLQVLPKGTRSLVVDERGRRRSWPPAPA